MFGSYVSENHCQAHVQKEAGYDKIFVTRYIVHNLRPYLVETVVDNQDNFVQRKTVAKTSSL